MSCPSGQPASSPLQTREAHRVGELPEAGSDEGRMRFVPHAPDELMTLSEMAVKLRISRSQARRLLKSGRVPFLNVGAGNREQPRIRRSDMDAFMQPKRASMLPGKNSETAPLPRGWRQFV